MVVMLYSRATFAEPTPVQLLFRAHGLNILQRAEVQVVEVWKCVEMLKCGETGLEM